MKKLRNLFIGLAILLSDIMCAVVAWDYQLMLCGIAHEGYSAPAWIALLLAIPFLILIGICVVLAILFNKKSRE